MIIVVGVDETDRSQVAARKARRLAELLDAQLEVVFVNHVPGAMLAAMAGVPAAATEYLEAQRVATWKVIDPIVDESLGPVHKIELEGYPADTLVDYATKAGAGLIVVGSRGRGDLASLVLGSTSHRVVNQATCDVLIAKGK